MQSLTTKSHNFLIVSILAAIGLTTIACESRATERPPESPATSRWLLPVDQLRLSREVDAGQLVRAENTIYLAERWPEQQVSRFSLDGKELGTVFQRGRAPWEMLEASEDIVQGPAGTLGLIDVRSYRLSFIDSVQSRFLRSFLVSGYEFMPMGGVGDPDRERIYLFTNNVPEVRVLDFEGREISSFEHYEEHYTSPYKSFRGAVDADGNLLYCPRSAYRILRVSPDGATTLFASAPTGAFVDPLPIPEKIRADLQNTEQRWAWEKTVSWIDRLAVVGEYVLVSYSVPPGLDEHRVDIYSDDGTALVTGLDSPGRLLGCEQDLNCWFLAGSKRELIVRRIAS